MGPISPPTTTTTIPQVRPIVGRSADTLAYRIGILAVFVALVAVVVAAARTPRVRRFAFSGGIVALAAIGVLFALTFPEVRHPAPLTGVLALAAIITLWLLAIDNYWWPYSARNDFAIEAPFKIAVTADPDYEVLALSVINATERRTISAALEWVRSETDHRPVHKYDRWIGCWAHMPHESAPWFVQGEPRTLLAMRLTRSDGYLYPIVSLVNQSAPPFNRVQADRDVLLGSNQKNLNNEHAVRLILGFSDGTPKYEAVFAIRLVKDEHGDEYHGFERVQDVKVSLHSRLRQGLRRVARR